MLATLCVLRQRQVAQCAAYAAVAVFKRVDSLQPQVGKSRSCNAANFPLAGVKPRHQLLHLGSNVSGRRCLVVNDVIFTKL